MIFIHKVNHSIKQQKQLFFKFIEIKSLNTDYYQLSPALNTQNSSEIFLIDVIYSLMIHNTILPKPYKSSYSLSQSILPSHSSRTWTLSPNKSVNWSVEDAKNEQIAWKSTKRKAWSVLTYERQILTNSIVKYWIRIFISKFLPSTTTTHLEEKPWYIVLKQNMFVSQINRNSIVWNNWVIRDAKCLVLTSHYQTSSERKIINFRFWIKTKQFILPSFSKQSVIRLNINLYIYIDLDFNLIKE